jgi:putative restriction endonuclease
MAVKLVVAITDLDWFESLRNRSDLTEVNFWAPSGAAFRALEPGEVFLFKLHAPHNFIVGGGVFTWANSFPCSLAWEAFGQANGAASLEQMRARIIRYRRPERNDQSVFVIGCRILSQPVFLDKTNWIAVPESWSKNIVSFKTYTTDEPDGLRLWGAMEAHFRAADAGPRGKYELSEETPRWGQPTLIRPRLGQGAFRFVVTDIYNRRCAVTAERTLPALDAAHIRPYADGGLHEASNGLLLRRDIHSLFDAGYVTVTPDYRFEVSRRIREEYENGRAYYALHGSPVTVPGAPRLRPDPMALGWHNETRFRG